MAPRGTIWLKLSYFVSIGHILPHWVLFRYPLNQLRQGASLHAWSQGGDGEVKFVSNCLILSQLVIFCLIWSNVVNFSHILPMLCAVYDTFLVGQSSLSVGQSFTKSIKLVKIVNAPFPPTGYLKNHPCSLLSLEVTGNGGYQQFWPILSIWSMIVQLKRSLTN